METGILLVDLGNGNISLKYEKVYNRRMKMYQDSIRKQTDPIIADTFIKMKQIGKNKTFDICLTNMSMLYDIQDDEVVDVVADRKEYNKKYIQDLKKKQDIELSQNLLKIISNSEKLKNSEMNKDDNVVRFGMLNYDNIYEVNSLEQLKALNNKQYEKYIKLHNEQSKLIERIYYE